MSERSKILNASRLGKKAYWAGVPLSRNPMRARTSRSAWEDAWVSEKTLDEIDTKWRTSQLTLKEK